MAEAKLTKKQRKALEFRAKAGKGDAKTDEEVKEAKVDEQQDIEAEQPKDIKGKQKEADEAVTDDSVPVKPKEKKVKKAESTSEAEGKPSKTPTTRKRKQAEDVEASSDGKATKKKFDEDGNVVETTEQDTKEEKDTKSASANNDSKRYIVFVGNMSYKTTTEEITKHFADHCGEKPSVRLLTTKGDPSKAKELSKSKQKSIAKGKALDPGAPQSKGCAFVEFKQRDAMQKALQFHHTKLQGRSINVELTAGGGGKGAERKEKIAKKNKGLEEERRKLHEKYVKDTNKKSGEKEGQTETKKEEEPKRPQWGPNAAANGGKPRQATKIPRWAATGANATRLQT
ncbi:uncharacterized protein FA14DRAFT_161420 [Meira miltonrushii]|uniref:RRM domain-containing protein n=1 Tax=Meira miltonrushii TaxID=1280837 RepID=A0A316V8X6_9BASI|nr:uncharacterized protein FA14DRAFT_161420 [Meira miltonrushii]PWN33694.1 hypothetical protein FA14DRAFT_161420 [Meira miltonrushii]